MTWFASNVQFPPFKPTLHPTSGKWLFFQPSSPNTPVWSVGDQTKNVGPFALAIVQKPELTLGKHVLAYTEKTTTGGLLETWGKVAGKETEFVEVGLEQYERLFPGWGSEMGVMMEFWAELSGEEQWSGEEGILTAVDLGVEGLGGVEEAYRSIDLYA